MKRIIRAFRTKAVSTLLALSLLVSVTAVALTGCSSKSVDGILICANCKQAPAAKHTVACCLMDHCAASGYGVLVAQADKTYKFYAFDDAGDAVALDLLKKLETDGVKNYISVKVTGKFEDTAGTYDWAHGEKSGTVDYQGTVTKVALEYDDSHAAFAANAVEFPDAMTVEISSAAYTGSEVVPTVVLKDGDYTLKEGFDYTVACENNVDTGVAGIKITGVGPYYKGAIGGSFDIELNGVLICANCKHAPAAKHTVACCLMEHCAASGYGVLAAQADKTYKFYEFDDAGDALALELLKKIEADGVKNYITVKVGGDIKEEAGTYDWALGEKSGTVDFQGSISNVTLAYDDTHAGFAADAVEFPETMTVEIANAAYTGSEVVPDVVLTDGDYTLKAGFDYNVICENNVEIGTANIKIVGVGPYYKGTIEKTFEVEMNGVLICANCKHAPAAKHTVACCLMDHCAASGYGVLVAQPDKTYKFYEFDDAGDALALELLKKIEADGVKNYITVKVDGKVSEVPGTYDWELGEKSGTVDFQGTITEVALEYDDSHAGFAAEAAEFPETMTVEVANAAYTGSEVVPDVVLVDGEYTLKAGFDYNVICENNVEVGTANIKIVGVGPYYKGTIEKTFEITE